MKAENMCIVWDDGRSMSLKCRSELELSTINDTATELMQKNKDVLDLTKSKNID